MNANRIETVQGLSVVALTRYLMKKYNILQDVAFARLLSTELYMLLMDPETNLYLETNDYLCQACDVEAKDGKDALYRFINEE